VSLTAGDLTALTDGTISVRATQTDAAGNVQTAPAATTSFVLDTNPPTVGFTKLTGNKMTGSYSDTGTGVVSVEVKDTTAGHTFDDLATLSAGTWTDTNANVQNNNSLTIIATDAAGNRTTLNTTAPAGISGNPINLALTGLSAGATLVDITVAGMPSAWSLNAGTKNADGTWTVTTSDLSSLAVTTDAAFAGALVLNVGMSWTNSDGSMGNAFVADNVEAYPASPIFAVSGDDTLTGGTAGNNEFVFAQPIGNDTIYNFATASDTIDLIGFGLAGFGNLAIANNANGNAVVTLGSGSTITLVGVDAASLSAANFVFDEESVSQNAGAMTIGDGAILPIGGTVDNTGLITINSTGNESDLEILVRGASLTGGGQVTMSDNSQNVVFGGDASAVLDNVDNTISGAGQLGEGQLTLHNEGTIAATGTNALVIATGANTVVNTGTLQASGDGGLVVESALTGGGKAEISASSSIEFVAASDASVSFDAGASGALRLDQSGAFAGTIAGFAFGDSIDLADLVDGAGATLGYSGNNDNRGGTLTVGDATGAHTVNLGLLGQYAAADFVAQSDGHGGTLVTHVDPNQPIIVAHS
jgi:hypothetical protein